MARAKTDLRSPESFDHVGRDADATEAVAGRVLADLADTDERIVGATADLKWVTRLADFEQRHPDRVFQFGISERNMLSAAAGMATCGLRPYATTFAAFSGILGYEVLRTDWAYPHLPARVLATHCGISMGYFGTSHHATEDIAALRAVAGMTVVSPADGASLEALMRSTVDHPGPVYFRMGRGRERALYDGLPAQYRAGAPPHVARAGSDVLVVSTGVMVRSAVEAADRLAVEHGVDATVLDVHTLKPFDAEAVADHAVAHRVVVIVEEHTVEGGLGTLVREAVAEHGVATPVYKHGLYDEYGIIGPPSHLYRYYGLDPTGISVVARRALQRVDAGRPVSNARERLWTDDDRIAVRSQITGT